MLGISLGLQNPKEKTAMEREKIFEKHIPRTVLLYTICEELMQPTSEKSTHSKDGQRPWIDISPKKPYGGRVSTRKGASRSGKQRSQAQ